MARSLKVASQYVQQVKQALRINGYARQTDLAEELDLALSTISNFLNGRAVDALNFYEICRKLGLDSQQIADFPKQAQVKTIIEEKMSLELEADFSNYVPRPPIEAECYKIIEQPGSLLRIKAAKGMGKSLLVEKIIDYAKHLNYKTVNLDLSLLQDYQSDLKEKFLYRFCSAVTEELELDDKISEYWKESLGNTYSCNLYFQRYLLPQLDAPLVLCLNNVDHLFEHPEIADGFFTLLRAWHEKAKVNKLWQKLRLVLGYSTEVYISLDINKSPFNVGTPIELPEFPPEQVQDLAKRQGLDWDNSQVEQIMDMIGGHPYLLQLAIDEVKYQNLTLDKLLEDAPTEAGIYNNHLRELLEMIKNQEKLAKAMKTVIEAKEAVPLNSIDAFKLKSLGLVHLEGNNVKPSNKLYTQYFRTHLLKAEL